MILYKNYRLENFAIETKNSVTLTGNHFIKFDKLRKSQNTFPFQFNKKGSLVFDFFFFFFLISRRTYNISGPLVSSINH